MDHPQVPTPRTFHISFAALVEYLDAAGVYIMMQKYRLYGDWFELFGFEWLSAFDVSPLDDPEKLPVFLTTRDAYKDMIRFMLKYVAGVAFPSSERSRAVFEEVRRELADESA